MDQFSENEQENKESILWKILQYSWLLTVAASFEDGRLIHFSVPGIGTIFCFRVILPVTAVLFVVWTFRSHVNIWSSASVLKRWVYIFSLILMIYSILSIPRALSFDRTIRMLFNLSFDLLFFFLTLFFLNYENTRQKTFLVCLAAMIVLFVLGTYEVFFGGIINHANDPYLRFYWLTTIGQAPLVFSSNENDYASMIVFLLPVLTLGKILWRCDSKANSILSAALTGWAYFLLLASSARLCLFGFWIYLIGVIVYAFMRKENGRQMRIFVGLLFLLMILTDLCNNFQQISAELFGVGFKFGKQRDPFLNQFFYFDKTTGARRLDNSGSAGIRAHLLLHSFRCFVESHFLGVGLGNTGQLALLRQISPRSFGGYYESIHCFIARLIGDYGIFALIPLLIISFLLLRTIRDSVRIVRTRNDLDATGRIILYFASLVLYPFVSTASSDAQDIIPMWIYLATVVWYADSLPFLIRKGDNKTCIE